MKTIPRRWKRTAALFSVAVATAVVLNVYLLDGIIGWFWAAIGAAPTEFSVHYSEQAFRRIEKGMTTDEVRSILGTPLYVILSYSNGRRLTFEGFGGKPYAIIGAIASELTKEEARNRFGDPRTEGWSYGRSPTTSPYQVRFIAFESGRVVDVIHRLGGW